MHSIVDRLRPQCLRPPTRGALRGEPDRDPCTGGLADIEPLKSPLPPNTVRRDFPDSDGDLLDILPDGGPDSIRLTGVDGLELGTWTSDVAEHTGYFRRV